MKNGSLRVKLTLLMGCITALACLLLTGHSIFSAERYYGTYFTQGQMLPDGPYQEEDASGRVVDDAGYQLATQGFTLQNVEVMALIVALSLALTYVVTGRVLRPLTRLNRTIRVVGQENLHERVDLSGASGEVLQLSLSFNGMLARLEESFAMQKQFACNAAHELRTPLTVIKASLQVLEMEEHPAEADYREFMNDTRLSVERLIRTVDNLLALTRDASADRPERVALDALLEQVREELTPRAAEMSVALEMRPGAQTVLVNRTLLYRAVYNLVENALKYNRPGGRVGVETAVQEGRLVITVADDGIGMDDETLRHVFDPFFRADPSRSQRIPGSGLGLSIVKLIAERMDGEIEIKSVPDNGTTATLRLPAADG